MSEVSETLDDAAPVVMLIVPLAAAAQLFSTQVVRDGFEGFATGSGVPKWPPMSVQSGSALCGAGAVEVGPMLQIPPEQLSLQAPPPAAHASVNRLVEPSGVGPSGTVERPPPMLRPPQVRV